VGTKGGTISSPASTPSVQDGGGTASALG